MQNYSLKWLIIHTHQYKVNINNFMKVHLNDLNGEIIKDDDTYLIEDNTLLNNLVLSRTVLHPGKQTRGHSHKGVEEVYIFNSGSGRMILGDKAFTVEGGDVVLIPDGEFHKVNNPSSADLVFTCVFQTYER